MRVSMTTGTPPRLPSCPGVTVVPPTTMLSSPSGAPMTKWPLAVSLVSATSPRPCSLTLACPVVVGPSLSPLPALLPLGMFSVGTSFVPLMVMVSVAVEASPSASVMV
jgi:hypothetical protein